MPNPIRVAVIGYGLAGRVFHCPFVSAIPGLSLEAIVQRTADGAAEAYPQARILRTSEAAFADPAIDLVVIATPNETHESLTRAALTAGKHVVVDKPLAPTSAVILSLAEAAKAAGKHLIPFHNRRWDGDFLTIQQLLHEEKLGRVVKIISQWDRFRPTPRESTWKEHRSDAHGLLQDLGPHLLDQALTLFGLPQSITANIRKDRDGSEIEDAYDIVLTYRRPNTDARPALTAAAALHPMHTLHYECHATMLAADGAPRFQVHGTHGSYVKCGIDPQEAHLVADGRHPPTLGSSVPWLDDPETNWGTLTLAPDPRQPASLTRERLPTLPGDYRLFYAAVRDAILNNTAPPVSAIDAFRVARLIELARQSSHERRTLDVTFLPTP